jgi:hypothetical protein
MMSLTTENFSLGIALDLTLESIRRTVDLHPAEDSKDESSWLPNPIPSPSSCWPH